MGGDFAAHGQSRCRVIRSVEAYEGKQGPSYAGGVCTETVDSKGIWFGMITMPAGAQYQSPLA